MRNIHIKAILLSLALGLAFPAAVVAAPNEVDPNDTQEDNNEINVQHVQFERDTVNGGLIAHVETEGSGDNKWHEGSFIRTTSISITIKAPGCQAETITAPLTQHTIGETGEYVQTGYDIRITPQMLDSFTDPRNASALVATATNTSATGDFRSFH